MSGIFGEGPPKPRIPHGHIDVVQPFEAPEHFDVSQRRKVEKAVNELAEECGLRHSLTEDLQKRPGSYLIRVIGTAQDIDVFRTRLRSLKTE